MNHKLLYFKDKNEVSKFVKREGYEIIADCENTIAFISDTKNLLIYYEMTQSISEYKLVNTLTDLKEIDLFLQYIIPFNLHEIIKGVFTYKIDNNHKHKIAYIRGEKELRIFKFNSVFKIINFKSNKSRYN